MSGWSLFEKTQNRVRDVLLYPNLMPSVSSGGWFSYEEIQLSTSMTSTSFWNTASRRVSCIGIDVPIISSWFGIIRYLPYQVCDVRRKWKPKRSRGESTLETGPYRSRITRTDAHRRTFASVNIYLYGCCNRRGFTFCTASRIETNNSTSLTRYLSKLVPVDCDACYKILQLPTYNFLQRYEIESKNIFTLT